MSAAPSAGPAIWLLALSCGLAVQVAKLALYSLLARRPLPAVLGRGVGMPSLPAAVLTCLTVLLALRLGWRAPEAGLALVFTTLVAHDSVRLKGASQSQRAVLGEILDAVAQAGPVRRQLAWLLNVRAHRPFHVAAGVLFGLLYALAVGL